MSSFFRFFSLVVCCSVAVVVFGGEGSSLRLLRLLLGAVRVSPVLLVVGHGRFTSSAGLHGHGTCHEKLVLLMVTISVSICSLLMLYAHHRRVNCDVALSLLSVEGGSVAESAARDVDRCFGQRLPSRVEPKIGLVHKLIVEG